MDIANYTIKQILFSSWANPQPPENYKPVNPPTPRKAFPFAPLQPLRRWLNSIEVDEPDLAHRICRLIPAQCPFARKINLFGRTILTIPPMCKLNPFYDELMMLRFRALCYLADQCGEDISSYC